MANDVCNFIESLSDEEKLAFSRNAFRELTASDPLFARSASSLKLGADCAVNDRFLFLYLLVVMKEEFGPHTFKEYASALYVMRAVSFTLETSGDAPHGVSVHPDFNAWNSGDSNGMEEFMKVWTFLPESFRSWVPCAFAKIPKKFSAERIPA